MNDLDTTSDRTARIRLLDELLGGLELPTGRLGERALAGIVRTVARHPELFEDLVDDDPSPGWSMVLHTSANFDVHVNAWGSTGSSDWHDHGGSSGAYAVVHGGLVERFRVDDGIALESRHVCRGGVATFGASHIHDVVHHDGRPAISVHAYSPWLVALTYYDWSAYGFVVRDIVREPVARRFEPMVPRRGDSSI
jgi:hypothetical protein